MAQAGFTPIQLYFSTTASAVPTSGNLANGELAINIVDEKLYFKNSAGTVKLLASNATSAPVTTFSAGTTGFTPNTATSGAITLAGTLATTNGGTGLTSFTANGVVYASSSSALATGSALTFDGTTLVSPVFQATTTNAFKTNSSSGQYYHFDNASGNNFMGLSALNKITLYAGGAENVNFTSTSLYTASGINVGIGTSNPQDTLHVVGRSRLSITGTNDHQLNAATALEVRGPAIPSGGTTKDYFKGFKLALNDGAEYGGQAQFALGRWEESSTDARSSLVISLGNGAINSQTDADVDVMTLLSNGNVGIGTTSPSFRLHAVSSSAVVSRIGSSGGSGAFINFIDSGASPSVAPSVGAIGNSLVFMGDGSSTERARIDSSGNLLVGTTTASGIITTSANVNSQAGTIYTRNINASSGTYSGLTIGNNLSSNYAGYILCSSNQSSSGFLAANSVYAYAGAGQFAILTEGGYPLIFGTSGTERARFDSSGNLLVGATTSLSPSSGRTDISVNGSSNSIVSFGIGGTRQGYLYAPSTGMILASETGALSVQTAYTDPIQFNTNGVERMRIDSVGNIGIGTSSPSQPLDVAGTANITTLLIRNAGVVTVPGNTTPTFCSPASGTLVLSNNGNETFRVTDSNKFLVGTTSAYSSSKVTVSTAGSNGIANVQTSAGGYCFISNALSNGGVFYHASFEENTTQRGSITSNGSVTSYNVTSDYRLKTVVGAVTGQGARIDALEPIEYTWNSNGLRTRGFLAHKFQEVYADSVTGAKDAVDTNGKPVYQQMQAGTAEVIADLVAEIQSLRKRLADAGI